jgi:phage-related protein (TIGR01555 family)
LLSEMAQRPEYRRISEVLAVEMTRKWIRIKTVSNDDTAQAAKAERIQQLTDHMTKFDVRGAFRKMAEGDGFFGRMHLYFDTGDTDDRKELIKPIGDGRNSKSELKFKGRTGFLQAIKPVEPVWCYPAKYNAQDPLKGDWYNPQTWFVQGKELHATRLLTFVGREVPDMLKPSYQFGGLSLTQMAKPYVDNWLRTRQAVADLVWTFSVMVLKTNMEAVNQDGGIEFFKRLEMFANLRTNQGVMAIDKTKEELENVAVPLGGLHELQSQSQEQMCSVTGTPVVKLLGVQPAGLNASSEGELTTWYDWVAAFQEKLFSNPLTITMDFLQWDLWGERDPDITFEFLPLQELTEKEQAEVEKFKMDTDVAGVGAGILDPTESRKRLNSDPNQPYGQLDADDMPELGTEVSEGEIGMHGERGLDDGSRDPDAEALRQERERGGAGREDRSGGQREGRTDNNRGEGRSRGGRGGARLRAVA